MAHPDDTSSLRASIEAVKAIELEPEIEELADRYGAELTPQCVQPWELLGASRFDLLPPERQAHVSGCFHCALTFNHAPSLAALSAAAAAEASLWEPETTFGTIREQSSDVSTSPARHGFREIFAIPYRKVKAMIRRNAPPRRPEDVADDVELAR